MVSIHTFHIIKQSTNCHHSELVFSCFCFPGVTGTATLSTYSAVLANTIGVIYICRENKNLQIGYIDFMGRQHFVETTVDELRKCEKGPVKYGAYKTIKINDGKEVKVLKLPWDAGDIFDIKRFRSVFGK